MKNRDKRNLHAISAHFRKAGAHKDTKRNKKLDRKRYKRYSKEKRDEYNKGDYDES